MESNKNKDETKDKAPKSSTEVNEVAMKNIKKNLELFQVIWSNLQKSLIHLWVK